MRKAHCPKCGKEIYNIPTCFDSRLFIQCDVETVTYWASEDAGTTVVTPNGECLQAKLTGDIDRATGIGYIAHFESCKPNNEAQSV